MRFFIPICALLLAACATAKPLPSTLNQVAHDYVRLQLEIGAHEDGYIDAYTGPPELKTQAEANPRAVAALKAEAERLMAALEAIDPATLDGTVARRRAFLSAHLRAARFRLDMIEGARRPFAEEAEFLFDVRPALEPLETYDAVLARIDAIVSGEGPLSERVEAFRNRYAIPRDRLEAVMRAAIAECRRRTLAHISLPANETFMLEFVTDKSWSGYNWYKGGAQSVIQINTDFPIFIDRALDLGCHEGYPGHHTHNTLLEIRLAQQRAWIEHRVFPLFSPTSFIAEGEGNAGIDLAFPGDERTRFEADVLYPLAGLDPATAPAYTSLRSAMKELAGARMTIGKMYLDGEIDRARAIELVQRYQLVSRDRADQSLRFTEGYRSYIINYGLGEEAVRAHLDAAGASQDARWAAMARLLGEPAVPADLQR
jgi:hypothetical protein